MMHALPTSPRIPPLQPPYTIEIAEALAKWMPPGAPWEPLKLFRTLMQNKQLSDRMRPLGAGLLGQHSSLDPREREIVIDRVCARCGCEYEWGVHVVVFGNTAGLTEEQVQATVTRSSHDPVWSEREQVLLQLVDELHETATISDVLWERLEAEWSLPQGAELAQRVSISNCLSWLVGII